MSLQQLARRREQCVRLGAEHGYRIEGDQALINAELILPALLSAHGFALELWACAAPHRGGALEGTKVCELALDAPTPLSAYVHRVDARAEARVPMHGKAHAMVLALVEQTAEGERLVHDFANYPVLQIFDVPHFEGGVGYSLHDGEVTLQADAVSNPRDAGNLSGTLSLELWAWPAARDEMDRDGLCLAAAGLPRLGGQHSLPNVAQRAAFAEPPRGRWRLGLLLREWTRASGYVTRDRRTFARIYERDEPRANAPRVTAEPHDEAAVTAHGAEQPAAAPARSAARRSGVSINTASVEQLAKVKGLSLLLAKEIIRTRPYSSLDELIQVRGIGGRTLGRIKPFLTL